jgi:hypothetical protein
MFERRRRRDRRDDRMPAEKNSDMVRLSRRRARRRFQPVMVCRGGVSAHLPAKGSPRAISLAIGRPASSAFTSGAGHVAGEDGQQKLEVEIDQRDAVDLGLGHENLRARLRRSFGGEFDG